MKLLTHNMLKSHVKGVRNGYPLILTATALEAEQAEFNGEFVVRMLGRIDYRVFLAVAKQLGIAEGLPDAVPADVAENEAVLRAVHHALLEVNVVDGELECPETGRKFPIKRGVPNMLLNEDEV